MKYCEQLTEKKSERLSWADVFFWPRIIILECEYEYIGNKVLCYGVCVKEFKDGHIEKSRDLISTMEYYKYETSLGFFDSLRSLFK
jgi:hypothetical protein